MNGKNELGYHLNNKYITETIKTKKLWKEIELIVKN